MCDRAINTRSPWPGPRRRRALADYSQLPYRRLTVECRRSTGMQNSEPARPGRLAAAPRKWACLAWTLDPRAMVDCDSQCLDAWKQAHKLAAARHPDRGGSLQNPGLSGRARQGTAAPELREAVRRARTRGSVACAGEEMRNRVLSCTPHRRGTDSITGQEGCTIRNQPSRRSDSDAAQYWGWGCSTVGICARVYEQGSATHAATAKERRFFIA